MDDATPTQKQEAFALAYVEARRCTKKDFDMMTNDMIDFDEIKSASVKGWPNARDETEALCLHIAYLRGVQSERLALMGINANQAAMIGRAYMENDRLRRFSPKQQAE